MERRRRHLISKIRINYINLLSSIELLFKYKNLKIHTFLFLIYLVFEFE